MAKYNREKLLTEWDKLTVEEQYEELRFLKDHTQKKLIEKQKQVEEQSSELASKIEKLN
jgi:predicted RecB family endonuclease